MRFQNFPGRCGLIEGQDNYRLQDPVGQPACGCQGVGMGSLPRSRWVDANAHAYGVVAAVVTAFHLGNEALARHRPGGADTVQSGLGPGIGETDQLEAGYPLTEDFCQTHLLPVGSVVDDSPLQLLPHGFHHRLGGMAQYQGGHGADKVQPVAAVNVDDVGSGSPLHEDGVRVPED